MDSRRLVLGDWNPVVRDPIDVARAALVAGALAFLAAGEPDRALNLGVPAALAVAARPLELPRVYDACFVAAMALAGLGEALRLYDRFGWFDVVVHTSVPLLGAPVVYIALARLDVLPDPRDDTSTRHHVGIFIVTLSFGLAIGGIWEMLEWTSDTLLGTNLAPSARDTIGDLTADAGGALVGAALLVVWTVAGWGSVRRIPGENRTEAVDA